MAMEDTRGGAVRGPREQRRPCCGRGLKAGRTVQRVGRGKLNMGEAPAVLGDERVVWHIHIHAL